MCYHLPFITVLAWLQISRSSLFLLLRLPSARPDPRSQLYCVFIEFALSFFSLFFFWQVLSDASEI
jgi:hypothetical protein